VRSRLVVGVLAVALCGALAAPAVAQDEGPPVLRAKSGKRVVQARVVSFCWFGPSTGMCADGVYGHSDKALKWKARAPLVFGLSSPVDSLEPCLMRIESEGRATPLGVCLVVTRGDDGKWRGTLPKNLRGANSLSVFVRSGRNDAFYAVSIAR
jgi:hypothetical protein